MENLLFLYSLQYFKHNKSFNKLFPEIPVWDSLAHGELSWGPEVVTHLRILIMEMASQSVPDVFAVRWSATCFVFQAVWGDCTAETLQ